MTRRKLQLLTASEHVEFIVGEPTHPLLWEAWQILVRAFGEADARRLVVESSRALDVESDAYRRRLRGEPAVPPPWETPPAADA